MSSDTDEWGWHCNVCRIAENGFEAWESAHEAELAHVQEEHMVLGTDGERHWPDIYDGEVVET